MPLNVTQFGHPKELEDFLNGILIGGAINNRDGVDVRGLTLVFTTPAVTVTFPSTAAFASATASAIAAEINSQTTQATSTARNYGYGPGTASLALIKASDVLDSGTALAVLGLSAGTVGATAVPKANIIQVFSPRENAFSLVYES
jgi:hypothetical protein